MKKVLSVLFAALLVLPMSAQVKRFGNQYVVDGQMLKSKDFATYMQENAEVNLGTQFKNGLELSKKGWCMFGCGLGSVVIGASMASCAILPHIVGAMMTPAVPDASQLSKTSYIVYITGVTIAVAGEGCTIAGIACLGVGYDRMHKSADTYIATRQTQPQAYISLQTSPNGIGLALNF